jgi:hypothetical protein
MASSTRATVFWCTPPRPLMTRSTVAVLTPARAARSETLGLRSSTGTGLLESRRIVLKMIETHQFQSDESIMIRKPDAMQHQILIDTHLFC